MSHPKSFPLDALKIDRSFVKDFVSDSDDAAIVQAIIAFAKSLKLTAIAEGAEELPQLALLKAFGCDEYQGHYFSRPLSADQMTRLLGSKRGVGREGHERKRVEFSAARSLDSRQMTNDDCGPLNDR